MKTDEELRAIQDRVCCDVEKEMGYVPRVFAQRTLRAIYEAGLADGATMTTEMMRLAEERNGSIKALQAIVDALPRCHYPGCTNHAIAGVVSHEPDCCDEHDGATWVENGSEHKLVGLRGCDYSDELREALRILTKPVTE